MEKFKKVISENKYIILLTIVALTAAITEIVSAQLEILYRKNIGMSFTYGVRHLLTIAFYFVMLFYFSFTVKKRRNLDFILALFLLIAALLSFAYLGAPYLFVNHMPSDYYKLIEANPVVFKIGHFYSEVYGEEGILKHIEPTYTFNFIAAMAALATCITTVSVSAYKIKNNKIEIEKVKITKSFYIISILTLLFLILLINI